MDSGFAGAVEAVPLPPSSYVEQYLAPFRAVLENPAAIELAINADGRVWVERAGDATMSPLPGVEVTPHLAHDLASAIAGDAQARVSRQRPLVSGKILWRGRPIRIQIAIPPAVERGTSITIRLFGGHGGSRIAPRWLHGAPVSLDDRRRARMLAARERAVTDLAGALEQLVSDRLNILVSGGTSSGKTTVARHLLRFVPRAERLVTIEDALELFPEQPNLVSLVSERDPASGRSPARLLEAALRMRPDRIVVGELRGVEALTYLEAINTGHGGSVTTIHAETARLAIDRLAFMILQAPLSFGEGIAYVTRSIDVIVQLGRDGARRGVTELFFPGEPALASSPQKEPDP